MTDVVQAYIENECLLKLEDYLKRGRQLAGVDAEELIALLKSLFRDWAGGVKIDHREREDIMAELELRNVDFFDRISEEWAAMKAASHARFERLTARPGGFESGFSKC